MRVLRIAIAGIALALGGEPAAAVDFVDTAAAPLRFAVESVSEDAVTVAGRGAARLTCYNLEAPPDNAALTTTTKLRLSGSETWYVRVDLDGVVFSATSEPRTSGEGSGSGFARTQRDAVAGGAGEPFVIHRLPAGADFAQGLSFGLSIRDTLAVPAGEGSYRATTALYDELAEAYERERRLSRRAFGGEKTVVVMTSGLEFGFETGIREDGRSRILAGATSVEEVPRVTLTA